MKTTLKIVLLLVCVGSFLGVILFPPFYLHPKDFFPKDDRLQWALFSGRPEADFETIRNSPTFMRRDWKFIASQGGKGGCLPVDWGMLALELVGVLGIWFGTWIVFRSLKAKPSQK